METYIIRILSLRKAFFFWLNFKKAFFFMKISEKLLDFFNNPRVYKILRLLRKIIGESGTNSFAFTHFCLCINYTQPYLVQVLVLTDNIYTVRYW
jgi:hypothetical protein